jgi:hypothetical protein
MEAESGAMASTPDSGSKNTPKEEAMNTSKTAQATAGQMTTGSVTSTDGTPIGYR